MYHWTSCFVISRPSLTWATAEASVQNPWKRSSLCLSRRSQIRWKSSAWIKSPVFPRSSSRMKSHRFWLRLWRRSLSRMLGLYHLRRAELLEWLWKNLSQRKNSKSTRRNSQAKSLKMCPTEESLKRLMRFFRLTSSDQVPRPLKYWKDKRDCYKKFRIRSRLSAKLTPLILSGSTLRTECPLRRLTTWCSWSWKIF